MRKSRFTERQILSILAEVSDSKNGKKINEVCLKHGISVPTFYLWKSKHQTSAASGQHRPIQTQAEVAEIPSTSSRSGRTGPEDLLFFKNRVAELEREIEQLQIENDQLRRIYIELSLDRASIKPQGQTRKTHSVA
jgi:putative transposase